MKLELHVIQNFTASNLNRDDTGSPKDVMFGGFRRSRVSSQCSKRSARVYVQNKLSKDQLTAGEIGAKPLGVRTGRLLKHIVERHEADFASSWPADHSMHDLFMKDAHARAGIILRAVGATVDEAGLTKALIYVSDLEVGALAALLQQHWDQLDPKSALVPSAKKVADDGGDVIESADDNGSEAGVSEEAGSAEGPAPKKGAKPATKPRSVEMELSKAVSTLLRTPLKTVFSKPSMDIALFGRFMADRSDFIVDAACQVAHPLGVSKLEREFDYFTAVDDLKEESGAQHLGTVEFNAPTLYRYAVLDTVKLLANLGGDEQLARRAISLFFEALAVATPSGKQNTFAAHNMPSFVGVVARGRGPMNLANAFESPIRPRADASLTEQAIEALNKEDEWASKTYGAPGADKWRFVDRSGKWSRGEKMDSAFELATWAADAAYPTK